MAKYKVTIAEQYTHYRTVEVEADSESEAHQEANDAMYPAPSMEDLEWAADEIIDVEEI